MQRGLERTLQQAVAAEEALLVHRKPSSYRVEEKYRQAQTNTSGNTAAHLFFKHFQVLDSPKPRPLLLQEDERLIVELQKIDTITLRHVQIVPLLYFKTADSPTYECSFSGDEYFNNFLKSLGAVLEEPHIKTGHFDSYKEFLKATTVVYSANFFTEQLFLVPSLKPVKNPTVHLPTTL